MVRTKKYGVSFSWRRATGLSAAKGKLSRELGVPLTKSGRQRKVGRAAGCLVLIGMIVSGAILALCLILGSLSCSSDNGPTSSGCGGCGSGDVYWDGGANRCRDNSNGHFVKSCCCGHKTASAADSTGGCLMLMPIPEIDEAGQLSWSRTTIRVRLPEDSTR